MFRITRTVLLAIGICASNNDQAYIVQSNFCMKEDTIKTMYQYGKKMCLNECNATPTCQSNTFIRNNLECQLSESKNTTQLIADDNCTYNQKVNTSFRCGDRTCTSKDICLKLRNGNTKCIAKYCDSALRIGGISYASRYTTIGTSVTVPCANPDVTGYRNFTCKSNGTWAETSETCADCDEPLIVNGLQYTSANQPVLFGVRIGCATTNDGYSFSGDGTTYYCQQNGEWTLLQDNCNGFAYKIYQNDLTTTWTVSRQRCIGDGADLAVVDTQEKFEALSNAVANHELNSPYYFIGMSDKALEGTFVWINDEEVVYDGWDDGQPANWNNEQHCGIYEKTSAKWHDFNCDTDCNYICGKIIT